MFADNGDKIHPKPKHAKRGGLSRRRLLAGAPALAALAPVTFARPASAQQTPEQTHVKIMVDWIIQGTHAPFFIAQEKGYYKDGGVTVDKIDPGRGATNVAISVASGAYDFGWVDMPSMINFNAANPSSPLIASYISFDATPLTVIAPKSKNILSPKDLDGKTMAGGPGGAGHDTISILLKAAHAESVKINWLPIQPQLVGTMIKNNRVDGTVAFINSVPPDLVALGIPLSDLRFLRYSDYGADMYGLTLATTQKFLQANPNTVRAVVSALNRGTRDTIADPSAALALMQSRDAMMRMDIEKIRLDLALSLTDTPHVRKYGLSTVDPKKLQFTIDSIVNAYHLKNSPAPAEIYTAQYLPPLAERMLVATK